MPDSNLPTSEDVRRRSQGLPVIASRSAASRISRMNHRLRQHADYQRVYKTARKQFGKQIAYFHVLRGAALPGREVPDGPRVGLTVPKALGKAVDRNRIKRRLRECVHAALPLLTADVDVVLHPRRSVLTAEFAGLEREVATIFRSVQAACERSAKQAVAAETDPVRG